MKKIILGFLEEFLEFLIWLTLAEQFIKMANQMSTGMLTSDWITFGTWIILMILWFFVWKWKPKKREIKENQQDEVQNDKEEYIKNEENVEEDNDNGKSESK